ncbi:flagellar protein FliS [Fontimonas thermophila]|uniref:Flagellar secretion chaperone FliS n=1 Tax=Fontimonas thermophila TaxID=1076937 RepID=A0A1I2HVM5_9GAMM|nr:flagellar export chaperone FliS [Fontimonas thermophila]SFF33463.1 flagellar protein FliS [Fontimonas thermophila]
MSSAALDYYRATSAHAGVEAATPHKLVEMLYAGILERLITARGAIGHGDRQTKLRALSSALAIVEHLRLSLDHVSGGEIARNLDALYDYMGRRLLQANLHDDVDAIDELLDLTRRIKSAWDAIAPMA